MSSVVVVVVDESCWSAKRLHEAAARSESTLDVDSWIVLELHKFVAGFGLEGDTLALISPPQSTSVTELIPVAVICRNLFVC